MGHEILHGIETSKISSIEVLTWFFKHPQRSSIIWGFQSSWSSMSSATVWLRYCSSRNKETLKWLVTCCPRFWEASSWRCLERKLDFLNFFSQTIVEIAEVCEYAETKCFEEGLHGTCWLRNPNNARTFSSSSFRLKRMEKSIVGLVPRYSIIHDRLTYMQVSQSR